MISNCTTGHLFQRKEDLSYTNSPKLETEMTFNDWMVKQTVVHPYHGEKLKANPQSYILYDSIC